MQVGRNDCAYFKYLSEPAKLPMRRSAKRVKRVPRHAGDVPIFSEADLQWHQPRSKEPYVYESKPIMGSKTPDDHRRAPNGMGEKVFALRCKLF